MPRLKILNQQIQTFTSVSGQSNGSPISLDGAQTFSVQSSITVNSGVSGASIKLQSCNDLPIVSTSQWNDLGISQSITATGSVYVETNNPTGIWVRYQFNTSSGNFNSSSNSVVKGLD